VGGLFRASIEGRDRQVMAQSVSSLNLAECPLSRGATPRRNVLNKRETVGGYASGAITLRDGK
jgi:hypothetical protein